MKFTEEHFKVLLRDAMSNLGRLADPSVSLNNNDFATIVRYAETIIDMAEKIDYYRIKRGS